MLQKCSYDQGNMNQIIVKHVSERESFRVGDHGSDCLLEGASPARAHLWLTVRHVLKEHITLSLSVSTHPHAALGGSAWMN